MRGRITVNLAPRTAAWLQFPQLEVPMRSRRVLVPRPPRHALSIPCQVVRMRDFRLLADCIENLSLGGLLAGTSAPAAPGEPLIVSFCLPGTREWVDTDAVVARVIHGRRPADRQRQLGIRFTELTGDARRSIQWALWHAPPVAPQPRPGRRDPSRALHKLAVESGWVRSAFGHALVRWWPR
jgi:hypothetical protein